ncbi:MAG: DUF4215 domain-containing protein [Kofleriaceae bacterium]|nr:DUF4215 domain-containing protein [Kofleriaceae bacterium]
MSIAKLRIIIERQKSNVWEYFIGFDGLAFEKVESGEWTPCGAGNMYASTLKYDGGFQESGHQGMLSRRPRASSSTSTGRSHVSIACIMGRGAIAALALVVTGCLESPSVRCANGIVCGPGNVCDDVHGGCVTPQQLYACDGLLELAVCPYGAGLEGTCRDGVCLPAACGNARIDGAEECDEGESNADTPEATCRTNCLRPRCGDGVREARERCDDGNNVSNDGCSFDCLSDEMCGNGYVDFSQEERCDDADAQSHDGCTGCRVELAQWSTSTTPGTPSARSEHAIAYDAARGRVMLFGGTTNSSTREDTWELFEGAWLWAGAQASGGQPGRKGHAVATVAARGSVVMFGGLVTSLGYVGDTWEWNGTRWAPLSSAGGAPSPRAYHAMAYDAGRDRLVLFGGTDGALRQDTWEWDGTTWRDVTPATGSPPAREKAAMAYDPVRGRVILFGGTDGAARADTWAWDGTAWTDVTPTLVADSPPARAGATMAFDVARARTMLFGGSAGGVYRADTWAWDGAQWIDVTPAAGPDPVPAGRHLHGMTYDGANARLVMFGGFNGSQLGDTWAWSGTAWSLIPDPPTLPVRPTRPGFGLTYDAGQGVVLLFGGEPTFNDTWAWNGIEWRELTPQQAPGTLPAARRQPLLAYDQRRRRVVMFGGIINSNSVDETWEWDGFTWTHRTPAVSPPGRAGATLAYDAGAGRIVLFGGDRGGVRDDLWTYDGDTWTMVPQTSPWPAARSDHAVAYDVARRRLVLFGGRNATSSALSDTWEWDGTSWIDATPLGASPFGRSGHALAYDGTSGHVVLFGGQSGNTIQGDTWEWDGAAWTNVTPALGNPLPRTGHEMAWDAKRGRTWVYAGFGGNYEISSLRYERVGAADDGCGYGLDGDRDGLVGCADPDCFGVCAPLCNPTMGPTCDTAWPRCGDGACTAIESPRTCPADCGAPAAACGDFACDAPETAQSCPGDC